MSTERELGIMRVWLTDALNDLDRSREGASNDEHINDLESALDAALNLLAETQVYIRPST